MLEVQSHKNTCFDCGNEPVNHMLTFVHDYVAVLLMPARLFLAQQRWYRTLDSLRKWAKSRVVHVHYTCLHALGITRFKNTLDESLSNRAKLVWQAALDKGYEIECGYTYGRPTEHFRVRVPKNAAAPEMGKTRWFYGTSLPYLPWKDTTYLGWIDDKLILKDFLRENHIFVPRVRSVVTLPQALAALGELQGEILKDGRASAGEDAQTAVAALPQVVVKPRLGSRSRHTTIGVQTEEDMAIAFAKSHTIAHHIVVEEQLLGKVCRATLINAKLVGFTAMSHPQVVGEGVQTIAQLIHIKNDKRNKRVQSELSVENPDVYPLREKGYTLDTVLAAGEVFVLKQRAGWMYGGEGREMLNDVHPQLTKVLERAAELLNAQLVAFDVIIEDPEADPAPQKWGIIEANSVPYIEVHIMPTVGERINVALQLWDLWKDIPKGWR